MSQFLYVRPAVMSVVADFTELNTFTSEASLLQGVAKQPVIPRGFWERVGAKFRLRAFGVVSTTGTPTFQFEGRLSATVGVSTLTGTKVGESAAITTGSGVANSPWVYELELTCRVPGQGSGNTTINCRGTVRSPGFAAPYEYILVPATASPQTWTVATAIQNDVDLYFNLSAVCGTSSASNKVQCKEIEWSYW